MKGWAGVFSFGGQDYSMRVWLDPDKLQARNLTAGDVIRVLREQNVQVAAGQIGQAPVPRGQDFQYTMNTLGRLIEAEQFADIVLKTGADGEVTYLRDVARTELGAKSQDQSLTLDGQPSVGLAIFQLPGSNALDVADRIKARMRELEKRFPKGLKYAIVYDTTPFVPRVGERSLPHAPGRSHPGRPRRPPVSPGLAIAAPASDRRRGGHWWAPSRS